jgi:hypothetical protein
MYGSLWLVINKMKAMRCAAMRREKLDRRESFESTSSFLFATRNLQLNLFIARQALRDNTAQLLLKDMDTFTGIDSESFQAYSRLHVKGLIDRSEHINLYRRSDTKNRKKGYRLDPTHFSSPA